MSGSSESVAVRARVPLLRWSGSFMVTIAVTWGLLGVTDVPRPVGSAADAPAGGQVRGGRSGTGFGTA
ncbi:hypothetical protein SVTN_07165 [Streptomyces vietnamensis]|uniref:Uncharacterized protein n=1 Tax=Streptomyces vietnamensis TaxID=362257 RepID=A0A0B5I1A4_9ACTN|nr:hypothetical protein SVTN_07165 [Streptomyces vietnamensis]